MASRSGQSSAGFRSSDPVLLGLILLDNRSAADTAPSAGSSEDDAQYAQFTVPGDLLW
ncbi:hypothetical protein [Silanimonas sp.]|uniref:hypothetical protein n=1 Tax=Silanimonas sp. TaxID=1929290 RepID=UPI0022CB04E8|nr:hypothetical protein [Silanimonas sp.]MCZ8061383.1 hypothetical protein [Silanimonas sp.]